MFCLGFEIEMVDADVTIVLGMKRYAPVSQISKLMVRIPAGKIKSKNLCMAKAIISERHQMSFD